jgi:hypothetical protein
VEDGTRTDEPNPGNDLRCNACVVASIAARQLVRQHREHGGAKTDEQVSTQASWFVAKLPFEANRATEKRGYDQTDDRRRNDNA